MDTEKPSDRLIGLAIIILIILLVTTMVYSYSLLDPVKHEGSITMKWGIPKLTTTHYYFEIDNTTKINVDSYDYHKFKIGDTYTWETME